MDISALASMKNVAKCDTWCELQNPVNHRVFERKLRPKPLGRGHVCLGVTHRRPPRPRLLFGARGPEGGDWPPVRSPPAVGPNSSPRRPSPRRSVAEIPLSSRRARPSPDEVFRTLMRFFGARSATPGQAGIPAEFKHINKRRKRNLPGFP